MFFFYWNLPSSRILIKVWPLIVLFWTWKKDAMKISWWKGLKNETSLRNFIDIWVFEHAVPILLYSRKFLEFLNYVYWYRILQINRDHSAQSVRFFSFLFNILYFFVIYSDKTEYTRRLNVDRIVCFMVEGD